MPNAVWNLQDAKAKLSELVDRAQAGAPQIILRRGKRAAVVVSVAEYEAMHPREPLISFLLRSPLVGSGLDFSHAEEPLDVNEDVFGADR